MTMYGSGSVVIELDGSDGGALADITQYIQGDVVPEIERLFEESDTFGDSWEEALLVGFRRMGNITLEGIYNTTIDGYLNGTHAVSRTLKITYGGTKTTTVEVLIISYRRSLSRRRLHRFSATLKPTGAVTEE